MISSAAWPTSNRRTSSSSARSWTRGPRILAALEDEASVTIADRLVAAVRSDGLGVSGYDLEALVRAAAATSAAVEVVRDHDGLARLGGVGALLRYRRD